MKSFAKIIAAGMLISASAFAQQSYDNAPPPPPDNGGSYDQAPPAPPANVPPPQVTVAPQTSAPAAQPLPPPPRNDGQWVWTNQYGWLWMPYGQSYTYVAGDSASMYVFYPHYGWRWVAAPWVLGVGPLPRWGRGGVVRFAWYSHPWFRGRVVYGRHPVRVVRRRGRW